MYVSGVLVVLLLASLAPEKRDEQETNEPVIPKIPMGLPPQRQSEQNL